MGSATAHAIIQARNSGRFTSLHDFVSRIEQGAINRRALESLISAGAFDSLMPDAMTINQWRPRLCAGIDDALAYANSAWNDKLRGQSGLFGETAAETLEPELPDAAEWSDTDVLSREKAAVGFYLSSHPLDRFTPVLESLRIRKIADFDEFRAGSNIVLAGMINDAQVRWSKKGNRFCSFRLEDASASVKCLVWSDAFAKCSKNLYDDASVIIEGKVEAADGSDVTVIVSDVRLIDEQVARAARNVSIAIPSDLINERFLDEVFALLSGTAGRTDVFLDVQAGGVVTRLAAPVLAVQGSVGLEQQLVEKGCSVKWSL
jgi:DNA polymerase-3 subunit alpha